MKRKGKKIYPLSSAFCFAYRDDFYTEQFLQKVAEVLTADTLEADYYYRNSFEIDFIQKQNDRIIPFEVKYGEPKTKQISTFLKKFNVKKGFIISKDVFQTGNMIDIVPLWYFMLKKEPL